MHFSSSSVLAAACREYDKCFKAFFSKNDACNAAFRKRLLPIIQKNSLTSYKGVYASAAYKRFS